MDAAQSRFALRPFLIRVRVFVFCAIGLVCLDLLVASQRPRWERYDPDDYAVRVRTCRQSAHDLLVIGGSPVTEGIDPARLQGLSWADGTLRSAFNLGLPGGTTTEFCHAVRHGVRRPPRLLIYGITASDLNDARQEPHGPSSLVSVGDLAEWARTNPRTAPWAVKHFARGRLACLWQLYRHRNAIRLWSADQAEAAWPGAFPDAAAEARRHLEYAEDLQRPDGYAPNRSFRARRYDQMKASGWRCERFHFLEQYRVGEHARYLHRLLDWCAAVGTRVVLVDMPVTADLEYGPHAPAFATYRALLADVESARSVRVLRAHRDSVGLGDEHFADLIHLNSPGAERLSLWLRHQLESAAPAVAGR